MIHNTTEDCEAMVIYQLILQNKVLAHFNSSFGLYLLFFLTGYKNKTFYFALPLGSSMTFAFLKGI